MQAPYETTGMRDTLAGYAGWFIENRVAPAAPYFVAFVLCLGLLGGAMAEVQAERGGFEIYDIPDCQNINLVTAQPGICGIKEPFVTAEAYNGFSNSR